MRLWNKLPEDVKETEINDSGTNTTFKRLLRNYYKHRLEENFDSENICSWLSDCRCARCRLI